MKVFIFFIGIFCLVQHQVLAVEFSDFQKNTSYNTYAQLILDLIEVRSQITDIDYATLHLEDLVGLKLGIDSLSTIISEIKKTSKLKEYEWKEVQLEWKNLLDVLNTVDDLLIYSETKQIEAFFDEKSDRSRLLGIEKFETTSNLYEIIKQIYIICDKGVPSEDEAYNELEVLVALEKNKLRIEQGETERIDFQFSVLHYSKNIDFYQKEDLVEKIEAKTNREIEVLLRTRSDLDAFKAELNIPYDSELKRYFKQLNCILGKEEKYATPLNLTLEVYFKRVKENNKTGWIIDLDQTVTPKKVRKDTIVTLVCESRVEFPFKPKMSGTNFKSSLNYYLSVTRGAFIAKGRKPSLKNKLWGTSEIASDEISCFFDLDYDTEKKEIIVELKTNGDLKNIDFKKQHRYYSNIRRASILFKRKVLQLGKERK